MSDWQGNLDDDCTLERYGMFAHVERMDKGEWWFAITERHHSGCKILFNFSDKETSISLTTGKMARAAAECCMEVLRRSKAENAQHKDD